MSAEPILEVEHLVKEFTVKKVRGLRSTKLTVHAVSDVSFTVGAGQTVGLVGESGSGKTTVGRCVLNLLKPTSGTVRFKGRDLSTMSPKDLRAMRKEFQIVFQDPYSSLDPRMTVGRILAEPLDAHAIGTRAGCAEHLDRNPGAGRGTPGNGIECSGRHFRPLLALAVRPQAEEREGRGRPSRPQA